MSTRQQYLAISHAKAGMVLADNILDKQGHVLLPAGVTLTESIINSLTHHHVHQLAVVTADLSDEEEQKLSAQKLAKLNHITRKAPYPEPTNTLVAYLRHYRSGTPS